MLKPTAPQAGSIEPELRRKCSRALRLDWRGSRVVVATTSKES